MHPSDLSDEKKAEYLGFLQKNIDPSCMHAAKNDQKELAPMATKKAPPQWDGAFAN